MGQYFTALRKRWPVVLLACVIGGTLAFGWARTTPPTYAATSKVFVSVSGGQTAADLVQGTTYVKNLVDSYAVLATLPVVLTPVIEELGLNSSPGGLSSRVTADSPLNTSIIEIRVADGDPQRASRTSNAISEQLARTVEDLSPTASSSDQSIKVSLVSRAATPSYPVAPRTRLVTAVGLALGLALGVAITLLMTVLDTRVKEPKDLDFLGESMGVLGVVPVHPRGARPRPVALVEPNSLQTEAYRRVQTNLSYIDVSTPARMVVVTSATAGEGKTTTAVNLAICIAETGASVLLVDADLRRPTVNLLLGVPGNRGLTTVLRGDSSLEDVVLPVTPQLDVLTSGEEPPNPHQLVGSAAMKFMLEQARHYYDMVIIDTPPLLPVSDASILARIADGAVVVVGCKRVKRAEVATAMRNLADVGATCLGVVSTFAPTSSSPHSYYSKRPDTNRGGRSWVYRLVNRFRRHPGQHAPPVAYPTAAASETLDDDSQQPPATAASVIAHRNA